MSLLLRPWTIKAAKPFVRAVHRKLPKVHGALWAVSVSAGGKIVGCALVGHAVGQWSPGEVTLSVLRVAVVEGHKNACSMLYGSCSRMARAAGADNLVTYTALSEPGTSLRAAGWVEGWVTDGGEHSRPSRQRELAINADPKRRWWAAWSKRARSLS